MARLKREGLRPGCPDLFLAVPKSEGSIGGGLRYLFTGLFIEMKRKGGKPSVEQVGFAYMLKQQGYNALICEGADEAIRAINGYLES